MSIHPTLKGVPKGTVQRSVFSRIERIRMLLQKGTWKEGDSVIGLPKLKVVKVKFKKEKAEKTAVDATVAGTAPGAAPATEAGKSASGAKPAAVSKAAAPKAK
ncbi:MAG: small basic protein [Candidatus Omnitrophota bacterium]|nr:small basic protein [Candidatus Omnitrophota bacterium]